MVKVVAIERGLKGVAGVAAELERVVNNHEATHIFWGTEALPDGSVLVMLSEKPKGEEVTAGRGGVG